MPTVVRFLASQFAIAADERVRLVRSFGLPAVTAGVMLAVVRHR
jgi:hypothetical protein